MTEVPEELFPLIFDSVNDGVFTVDENFLITSFNAAAEQITGVPREEAIGKPCHDVFKANICQKQCALRETLINGQPKRDVIVDILNSNMEAVPIEVSTAVLNNADGKMIGGVEIFRDVSDVEILRSELAGQHNFRDIIGRSAAMRQVFSLLPQVAQSDMPVLVRGPSGTGKELIAQSIHDLSSRKDQAFIRVNCGALPDSLLESELFGYVKGAFTGAFNNKPGRFQQADKGTLFLDEIGDISSAFQVKLLRALEEGEIQPLGDIKTHKVDARLICATNRDLEMMVQEGLFREDLYYRIRVVPVDLPSLHERREDIPLLVAHFTKLIAARTNRKEPIINHRAMRMLYDYDYPGNVRELRNILERAFVLCTSGVIEPHCLPPEVVNQTSLNSIHLGDVKFELSSRKKMAAIPDQLSRPHNESPELKKLLKMLEAHNWNRSATAKKIGVSRTTLWRWMKEFDLV